MKGVISNCIINQCDSKSYKIHTHIHKYQTIFFIDITAKISNRINIRRMFTVKKKKVQFFTQRMLHK